MNPAFLKHLLIITTILFCGFSVYADKKPVFSFSEKNGLLVNGERFTNNWTIEKMETVMGSKARKQQVFSTLTGQLESGHLYYIYDELGVQFTFNVAAKVMERLEVRFALRRKYYNPETPAKVFDSKITIGNLNVTLDTKVDDVVNEFPTVKFETSGGGASANIGIYELNMNRRITSAEDKGDIEYLYFKFQ